MTGDEVPRLDLAQRRPADPELGEGDDLDGGEVLPGFRVAVANLFRVGR